MKFESGAGYRTLGAEGLALALTAVRNDTFARFQPFKQALHPHYTVPQRSNLNPPLWELGHIAWFQSWWLERNPHHQRQLGRHANPNIARLPSANADADALYNSSTVAHSSRWHLPLLDHAGVVGELERSLHANLALLTQAEASDAGLYFYRLCLAHEAMHAEAWAMMARDCGLIQSPQLTAHDCTQLQVPAQTLPSPKVDVGFSFDNERGDLQGYLSAFAIDSAPVSRATFANFLRADGQHSRADAIEQNGLAQAPMSHVNLADASACAAWLGRRLPIEHEWTAACLQHPHQFAWGDVWEWTSSPFVPFPGFVADPYQDYSQPWFGNHQVLKGASAWTLACMRDAHYRNFFLPNRTDVLNGFRTVSL